MHELKVLSILSLSKPLHVPLKMAFQLFAIKILLKILFLRQLIAVDSCIKYKSSQHFRYFFLLLIEALYRVNFLLFFRKKCTVNFSLKTNKSNYPIFTRFKALQKSNNKKTFKKVLVNKVHSSGRKKVPTWDNCNHISLNQYINGCPFSFLWILTHSSHFTEHTEDLRSSVQSLKFRLPADSTKRNFSINLYVHIDLIKTEGTHSNWINFAQTSLFTIGLWQHCEGKRVINMFLKKKIAEVMVNCYLLIYFEIRCFSKISFQVLFIFKTNRLYQK